MSTGLARAKELYHHRSGRARELRNQGKKIVGYFCCFPPLEFLTALDLVPYRISGDVKEPVVQADAYLETIMCPFVRSCFDLALKGDYDFLDGLVVPHSCDTVQRIYDIWRYFRNPGYSHFIDVPHMVQDSSFEYFKMELKTFKKSLEDYTGREISQQGLIDAIQVHNENRALLRELYQLRKQVPPLLTGVETMQILVAGMGIPVGEYNQLLREVIQEASNRKEPPQREGTRLLIYGAELDDIAFIQLVEECEANVVMDDLCTGTRSFWHDVELESDPLDGIVKRYLDKVVCPRTYRPRTGTHQEDLENRFAYLREYVTEFKVEAAILYIIRFCDTHEFDVPDVRDYLQGLGLKVLHLEHDYLASTMEPLRTRIQAFLEMTAPVGRGG